MAKAKKASSTHCPREKGKVDAPAHVLKFMYSMDLGDDTETGVTNQVGFFMCSNCGYSTMEFARISGTEG